MFKIVVEYILKKSIIIERKKKKPTWIDFTRNPYENIAGYRDKYRRRCAS